MRELQALCRVHRHHHDSVSIRVILLDVCIERNFLQETGKRRQVRVFAVADDAGFELSHVPKPGTRLHIVLALEHRDIAGADQKLLIKVRQAERL